MLVVDGSHLLHRVRFQLTKSKDKKKGLFDPWKIFSYTFTRSLLNTIKELQDKRVIVCWDLHSSKRRLGIYPKYKERDPIDMTTAEGKALKEALIAYTEARKWLHTSLPKMGIQSIMIDGIEADDIAYWLVNFKFRDKVSGTNYLITEDADWTQSLRTNWVLYRPLVNKYITLNDVMTEYGVEGKLSLHNNPRVCFVVRKALEGDTSDNIVGCPGVGKVKANIYSKKLLKKEELNFKYKVDQNIYNFINSGKLSKNIELVDFRMITRSERRKLNVSFTESEQKIEQQNFLTWVDLASEIDSANMINFGGEYLEGWE